MTSHPTRLPMMYFMDSHSREIAYNRGYVTHGQSADNGLSRVTANRIVVKVFTPVYDASTGGSWSGATVAPEGEDCVTGQAWLACQRNSLRLEGLPGQPLTFLPGRGVAAHPRCPVTSAPPRVTTLECAFGRDPTSQT